MDSKCWQIEILGLVSLCLVGFVPSGANGQLNIYPPVHGIDLEVEVPEDAHDFVGPIELKDDRLFAVARSANCYDSQDGGRTWEQKGRFANTQSDVLKDRMVRPWSLIRLKSGVIAINFWVQLKPEDQGLGKQSCYFVKSADDGQTWSGPVRVSWPGTPSYPMWMIQESQKGRLIIGNEYFYDLPMLDTGFGICSAYYSDDEGDSWSESRDSLYVYQPDNHVTAPAEVPTVVETGDGRVLMFMRNHVGRIAYSYSSDQGEHWTTPKLNNLVSSNAEIYLERIPSTGDLVCIWNQASPEEVRTGYYRGRLTSAISKDMGKTWQLFRTVASSPGMEEISKLKPSPVKYNKSPFAVPPKEHIASEGFFMNVFPRIKFIGSTAYLIYAHREYRYPEGSNKFVREYSRRRLRVFDVNWFYDED